MSSPVRLNKYLAQAGLASRREADRLILEGRVRVNGKVVTELGVKVDPGKDTVEFGGRRISLGRKTDYILLNKPRGVLVTRNDPFGRPTVMDLLPPARRHLFPVGRLDLDSEGLLLLTNDGELANRLLHPRYEVKKVYHVSIPGSVDPAALRRLERGIVLDGKKAVPDSVRTLASGARRTLLKIEIHEGRKREIRRMVEALGLRIIQLKRVRFAGLELDRLKSGQWRQLRPSEIKRLKAGVEL